MTKFKQIIPPEGMDKTVKAINDICNGSENLSHFFITVDDREKQTDALYYMADMFDANRIRSFKGLDNFLFYTLDGTMSQINTVLFDIKTAAVYTNDFEGIIAFDISALADSLGEKQNDFFFSEVAKCARSATVVFFAAKNTKKTLIA